MDKPIAWYDPSNGAVSTDKDSPLFTPLGQVLPLYTKQEQEPVAWMQVTKYGNKLLAFTEPPLEPPCYTGEFIAAKNYPLFLKKDYGEHWDKVHKEKIS